MTDVSSLTQHAVYDVMDAFNISFEASIARIKLLRPDGYRIRREHIAYFNQYHIRYGYFCEECKNAEINPNSFCKICGAEHSVFEKGVDRLIYGDGVKLDENMRVLKCPRCDNEEFNEKADFCKICGSKVYNYCLGEIIYDYNGNIEDTHYHKNDSNARFCETCGRETVFFENKFLKPWKEYQDYINAMIDDNDDEWEEERTVDKAGCVSVVGNQYEVSLELVKRRILLRYDPFDLSCIQVWFKGERYEDATTIDLTRPYHHKVKPDEPQQPKLEGLSFFQAAEQRRRNELNGDPFTVVRERGHGHE